MSDHELFFSVTHSGWLDAKLAFPIHQAVFNDSKEARVSICGADTNYGGAQVHIFKHRLLQVQRKANFSYKMLQG